MRLNKRPVGQAAKTPPSQGGIMGSIPVRVTKKINTPLGVFIFLFNQSGIGPERASTVKKTIRGMVFRWKG